MLITLTAPSGGGKEYLKKALLQRFPNLIELCWTTTRSLRQGEIQGVTREHVSQEEFTHLKSNSELSFTQELFGGSYGIRTKYLHSPATYMLTEFHVDNVLIAAEQKLQFLAVALVPQDISFLRERLKRRDTETVTQIDGRITAAEVEVAKINQHRGLFSLVVTFSRENEHMVVDEVSAFLETRVSLVKSKI